MDVALRAGLLVALVVVYGLALALLRRSTIHRPRARDVAGKILIASFATAFTLLALETYTSANVRSDGYGFTLMGRAWIERHWHPINSLGYRDREHDPALLADERVLLVVGDSFAAGYGIEDPADRFPDLLQQRLGPEWRVVNVSGNGWSTAEEIEAIRDFPADPEAVVLSYHMNDFANAARLEGLVEPPFFHDPPDWLSPLARHSFLFDVIYWRLYRYLSMSQVEGRWARYVDAAIYTPRVWRRHRRELLELIRVVEGRGARLMVVLFPFMADVEWMGSRGVISAAKGVFDEAGVPTLNLYESFRGRDPRELTVNNLDAHPNEATHGEVADLLYQAIQRESW